MLHSVSSRKSRPTLHQCLCGHRAATYGQFRKHRAACSAWLDRPNPRGLSCWRRSNTNAQKARERVRLRSLMGRADVIVSGPAHVPSPEELLGEPRFARYLDGLDARVFSALLHALAATRHR